MPESFVSHHKLIYPTKHLFLYGQYRTVINISGQLLILYSDRSFPFGIRACVNLNSVSVVCVEIVLF